MEQAFIQWHGGEQCPVDHEERIDIVLRSGFVNNGVRAGSMLWRHEQTGADVVQFRKHGDAPAAGPEYARAVNDMKNVVLNSKLTELDPMTLLQRLDGLKRRV